MLLVGDAWARGVAWSYENCEMTSNIGALDYWTPMLLVHSATKYFQGALLPTCKMSVSRVPCIDDVDWHGNV